MDIANKNIKAMKDAKTQKHDQISKIYDSNIVRDENTQVQLQLWDMDPS